MNSRFEAWVFLLKSFLYHIAFFVAMDFGTFIDVSNLLEYLSVNSDFVPSVAPLAVLRNLLTGTESQIYISIYI